jgi:hypothetical protein
MTMPENRVALRTVPGRTHRESVAGPLDAPTTATEVLLGPDADGMTAWRYRIAAGEAVTGPDPALGRGQYWVVTDGGLVHDGAALPKLSCVFVYPDDPPFQAVAGADGLEIVAMQFPLRSVH